MGRGQVRSETVSSSLQPPPVGYWEGRWGGRSGQVSALAGGVVGD